MTDKNGVIVVFVDEASACRTTFHMSSGSYSVVDVQNPVQR